MDESVECSIMKRENELSLQHIVERAYQKYLKEPHLSRKKHSSLNVLRIMTAFREIFPSSPQRLYKPIMLIAKKYNPQSLTEWMRAIEHLKLEIEESVCHQSQESMGMIQGKEQGCSVKSESRKFSVQDYSSELDCELDSQLNSHARRSRRVMTVAYHQTNGLAPSRADSMRSSASKNCFEAQYNNRSGLVEVEADKENFQGFSNQVSARGFECHEDHLISFKAAEPSKLSSGFSSVAHSRSIIQSLNQKKTYKLEGIQKARKVNPYEEASRIENLSQIEEVNPNSSVEWGEKSHLYHNTDCDSKGLTSKSHRQLQLLKNCHTNNRSTGFINSKDSFEACSANRPNARSVAPLGSQSIGNTDCNCKVQNDQEGLQQLPAGLEREQEQSAAALYNFNLVLKSFTALLANYEAFEQYRHLKLKACTFRDLCLAHKSLISLKNNVLSCQQGRNLNLKAHHFYNQKARRKVWSVLNMLRQISTSTESENQKEATNAILSGTNLVAFEFIFCLMLGKSERTLCGKQNLNLQHKVQHFGQKQNFQKVKKIYHFFGLNLTADQGQIRTLFDLYRRCRLRKTFEILHQHSSHQKSLSNLHLDNLSKKALSALRNFALSIRKERESEELAVHTYERCLLKSCFLKFTINRDSSKLYSKKSAFIVQKRQSKTKKLVLAQWKCSAAESRNRAEQFTKKVKKAHEALLKHVFLLGFNTIRQESEEQQSFLLELDLLHERKLISQSFAQWIEYVKKKQQYHCALKLGKNTFRRRIMLKWFRLMKFQMAAKTFVRATQALMLRKLFVPQIKQLIRESLRHKQQQRDALRQVFECWRNTLRSQAEEMEAKFLSVRQLKEKLARKEFLSFLQHNRITSELQKQRALTLQKGQILASYLLKNRLILALKRMAEKFYEFQQLRVKKSHLRSMFQTQITKKITYELRSNRQRGNKIQSLSNFLTSQKLCQTLKSWKRCNKINLADELRRKIIHRLLKKCISSMSLQLKRTVSLNQKANNHYQLKQFEKGLLSIAKYYVQVGEKCSLLNTFLNSRKKSTFVDRLQESKQQSVTLKIKTVSLAAKIFFGELKRNSIQTKNIKTAEEKAQANILSKRVFSMLGLNRELLQLKEKHYDCTSLFLKSKFMFKLKNNFYDAIFDRKNTFMALKFHSIKVHLDSLEMQLQRLGFMSLVKDRHYFSHYQRKQKLKQSGELEAGIQPLRPKQDQFWQETTRDDYFITQDEICGSNEIRRIQNKFF